MGKKVWSLGKRVKPLPLLYETTPLPADFTKDTTDIMLLPGEVLYIPRGIPHCAHTRTLTESSLHITIGIEIPQEHTFQEILKQLAQKEFSPPSEIFRIRTILRKGLMSWDLQNKEAFNKQVLQIIHHLKECDEKASQLLERITNVSDLYNHIDFDHVRQKILKDRKLNLDAKGSFSFHRAFVHNFF
jgi:ribosomal protein L16 Arg81 hydroxylase